MTSTNDGSPFEPANFFSHADLHREREEEDLDLDGDGRPADGLPGGGLVRELEVQLDRRGDEAEHVDLAAQAEVAGERRVDVAAVVRLELEVDAGHDRDATARDAEVDRDRGAELERGLQDAHVLRA